MALIYISTLGGCSLPPNLEIVINKEYSQDYQIEVHSDGRIVEDTGGIELVRFTSLSNCIAFISSHDFMRQFKDHFGISDVPRLEYK